MLFIFTTVCQLKEVCQRKDDDDDDDGGGGGGGGEYQQWQ